MNSKKEGSIVKQGWPRKDPEAPQRKKTNLDMTLAEAIKWTLANSHEETRLRLRSRQVAYILLREADRLAKQVRAQEETIEALQKAAMIRILEG